MKKIITLARKIKHFALRKHYIKGILIYGGVRTGKSTLARHLHDQFSFSIIENDMLISALHYGFPELGCDPALPDATKNYKRFFYQLLNHIPAKPYPPSVIPLSSTNLSDLYNYPNIKNYLVITLGYTSLSKEELFNQIRKYEKKTWTSSCDDRLLIKICENILSLSKKLESLSKKYGFYFFDVSKDREEVFKKICKLVKRKVSIPKNTLNKKTHSEV